MSSCIIYAYTFNKKGESSPVDEGHLSSEIKSKTLAWGHFDVNHPDTKPWLDNELTYLDPFIVEALLVEETRPRITKIGDGILMILRGVNLEDPDYPEDMVSVRLWIDPYRIISLQKRKVKAVADMVKYVQSKDPLLNSGQFLTELLARLTENMGPTLLDLNEIIDDSEESILEDANRSERDAITKIRRQAIMLRRYMAPQRDAINQLYMKELSFVDEKSKRHIVEIYNNMSRYLEDLEAIRERAQIVKDEIATILADRLNKNMYILSIIAAIFLPLGFLTGLLGINVGGIPGVDSPYSFYLFCIFLAIITGVQIIVFKKMKWF